MDQGKQQHLKEIRAFGTEEIIATRADGGRMNFDFISISIS